jgi:hypothetical protein
MSKLKTRLHEVDDKKIEIVDGIYNADDMLKFSSFANGSTFAISRVGSNAPETSQYQKTLQSHYTLTDILNPKFDIFRNEYILNYLKKNNLRVYEYYVNLSTSSDIYTYHVDSYSKNSKTMLYYCNLEWESTWEGETHFSDETMRDVIVSCSFMPGRVCLFESTIPHKSSQPSPNAKFYRLTFTSKFVSSNDIIKYPESIDIQDFIYDMYDENLLSDKEKTALRWIKNSTINIEHSGDTLYNHLYKTFSVLKHLGCSEDVCLAGLYHSIYGTDFFNPNLIIDRETIVSLIGKYSEELVNIFCMNGRDNIILNNTFHYDNKMNIDLLYILYANLIEQVYRFRGISQGFFAKIKNRIIFLEKT